MRIRHRLLVLLTITVSYIFIFNYGTYALTFNEVLTGMFTGDYNVVEVKSGSMEPTLYPGDSVVICPFVGGESEVQRGDILVIIHPVSDYNTIMRVIGMPGESLSIGDGKIYIDDDKTPLEETYLKEEWVKRNNNLEYIIPDGSYFVLGDNRNNSNDSRYWKDIAKDTFPDMSDDEAMGLSFVRSDQIVGTVISKVVFEDVQL